ncbi:hypothetical protein ACVPOQ_11880 [Staphylococcus aureus]
MVKPAKKNNTFWPVAGFAALINNLKQKIDPLACTSI